MLVLSIASIEKKEFEKLVKDNQAFFFYRKKEK